MLAEFAAARATAIDTPRMAFAPRFDLFGVPSRSFNVLSTLRWALTSMPIISSAITVLTLFTARNTVFPPKSDSLSRSSSASLDPVDAPDGTIARPKPQPVKTSTSTVGFPRESRTCLPKTPSISNMIPVCFMLFNLNLIASAPSHP